MLEATQGVKHLNYNNVLHYKFDDMRRMIQDLRHKLPDENS